MGKNGKCKNIIKLFKKSSFYFLKQLNHLNVLHLKKQKDVINEPHV